MLEKRHGSEEDPESSSSSGLQKNPASFELE